MILFLILYSIKNSSKMAIEGNPEGVIIRHTCAFCLEANDEVVDSNENCCPENFILTPDYCVCYFHCHCIVENLDSLGFNMTCPRCDKKLTYFLLRGSDHECSCDESEISEDDPYTHSDNCSCSRCEELWPNDSI